MTATTINPDDLALLTGIVQDVAPDVEVEVRAGDGSVWNFVAPTFGFTAPTEAIADAFFDRLEALNRTFDFLIQVSYPLASVDEAGG